MYMIKGLWIVNFYEYIFVFYKLQFELQNFRIQKKNVKFILNKDL